MARSQTITGGREATAAVIPGRYALSVGLPNLSAPKGWRWTPLSSVARLESGHTPSRRHPEYWGGSIPWVGIRDATGNHGRVIYETIEYTNELGIENSSARVLPKNTVCLSRTASVGYVVVMGRPMSTSQDFVNWICTEELNPHFLKYVLLAEREALLMFAVGSVHQTIYFPEAKAFHVCMPDRQAQDAIVEILRALDDKIELNRRMNETQEAMARAIFKDWFVDFGPTRAKMVMRGEDPQKDNVARAPYLAPDIWSLFPDHLDDEGKPEGWGTEAVYDQAVWVNGAAYKDMHFSSEPDALPVVKIAELKSGITKTTRFTNTDLGERYKIRDGELLFSWSGNPDTSIDAFIWTSGDAWLNQHIFAVRSAGKRSQAFLYSMLKFLRSDFAEIARNKQTTGLGHVTQKDLMRLKITAPSHEVAAAFDDIVGSLHARLTGNLFESQSLASIRDLLLPKLMSGEVRIKDAEKMVGEAL